MSCWAGQNFIGFPPEKGAISASVMIGGPRTTGRATEWPGTNRTIRGEAAGSGAWWNRIRLCPDGVDTALAHGCRRLVSLSLGPNVSRFQRKAVMGEFICAYWTFLPYLTLLSFLAVMSVWEGTGRRERDSGSGPNR